MQPRTIDLNEAVTSLAKMLRRILGEDIHLRLDLSSRPVCTRADAGMLDQVLLNLAVNARDAMPSGGRLTVATSHADLPEVAAPVEAREGRFVRLSVSDDGPGIPPHVLPRVFEPFFTTKEPGKGTGLGLATVFGIAKQHEGWVQVHSEPGCGAQFDVYLPACEAQVEEEEAGDVPARPMPRGSETVLLVEDDPGLRRVLRNMLELCGYRVTESESGHDALASAERLGDAIDLLVTDMVLPGGLSGRDVATAVRGAKPSVKVIFMSGYSPDLAGRSLQLQPGEAFIQKPFKPRSLMETIRRTLDA
jgi:CheY-like chemotaxis protein